MESRVQYKSKSRQHRRDLNRTYYFNDAGDPERSERSERAERHDRHRKSYKNTYCTNCGRSGHEYKQCEDAIISLGVILLKFDYEKVKALFADLIKGSENKTDITNSGIRVESALDINLFSVLKENIRFLLIRRKHTLGYIEFIRGRYKPDNVDGIVYLFQQMTKDEIERIGRSTSMTELWDDFWVDPDKKLLYEKEFQKTRQKFERLKNGEDAELTLDFYIKHVLPTWEQAEWGFPKGRRNKNESNQDCAVREFEEESGFKKGEYTLLEGIKPLVEELIGTNGVRYKHIYYVAYATDDKVPSLDESNVHQKTEVGDIGYYTYNEVMNMIRPYHLERKKIITKLYMYLLEKIINDNSLKD